MGGALERLRSGDQCLASIIPGQRSTQSSVGRRRGWLASYISAYLHPRLSFQRCPDFFTRGQLLARDLASLLLAARTKQEPGPPNPGRAEKTPLETQVSRVGVGTTEHNEGPSECSLKFLKSQLLECEARTTSSLEAKCVCHYSRSLVRAATAAAASVAGVRGARSQRTADSARGF